MAPKDGPGSERIEGNFRLVRGLILAVVTLTSLAILATFNRPIASTPAPPHAAAFNSTSSSAPASTAKAAIRFANLPLDFEVNRGQVNPIAKYIARAPGYSLFVDDGGVALSMERFSERVSTMAQSPSRMPSHVERRVVRMNLLGADPNAHLQGIEANSGVSNYFIGNDHTKWRTGIPHFNKIRENSVYSGIDLIYYGANRRLEYDFIVKPQGDPSHIRMRFNGADKLALGNDGNVVMSLGRGQVFLNQPVIYQDIDGQRHQVAGKFKLSGDTISIEVASYDHSRPLVIDPTLAYATYLGGSVADGASAIAADPSGDAYLTGVTCSFDFPTTTDVPPSGSSGCAAFVTELNPTGTSPLVYSSVFSSNSFATGTGIAVDASGAAYVVGAAGAGFPTSANVLKASLTNEVNNGFVLKLAPTTGAVVYSTYLGGSMPAGPYNVMDTALTVALAPGCASNCNAYVGGSTDSKNFPLAPVGGVLQPNNGGSTDPFDGFVSELNSTGSQLVYSTYLGGPSGDVVMGIAVDTAGATYVTGGTDASQGAGFPVKNSVQPFGGTADAFVAKLNSAGNSTVYATYLGGSGYDTAVGIAVDSAGNAYVGGLTYSSDFPVTSGSFGDGRTYGKENGFVARLNSVGSHFDYVDYLGGITAGILGGPVVDAAGNAYVTGFFDTDDFALANPLSSTLHPSGAVLSSSDGGSTLNFTVIPSAANTLALDGTTSPNSLYAATSSAGLLKSTDNGMTFSATGLNGYTNGLIVTNTEPAQIYVGTLQGLMKTTDGGATFASTGGLGSNPVFPLLQNTQIGAILVATGSNGVAESTDGATTFHPSTVPAHTAAFSGVTDSVTGNLYLGTNKGILVSTDVGKTFSPTSVNFDAINGLLAFNGKLFAGGQNNEVIESTDGFKTYSFPPELGPNAGPGYGFAAFAGDVTQIFAATDNGLYESSNGGTFSNILALGGINTSPFVGPFEFNAIVADFNLTPPVVLGVQTQKEGIIAEINPSGGVLFATPLSGSSADFGQGIALATNDSALYVDGTTASKDFPTTSGSFKTSQSQPVNGLTVANAFAVKILLPTATATATTTATATATSTSTATATASATATATATASHTATATASASATRTSTPTSTATSSATATHTPTATASGTATATASATAIATPTATSTTIVTATPTSSSTIVPTPVPSPGGNIVVATPVVNVIGKAGQTIGAGSFTYTNSEPETTEQLSSVTITVTEPEVLSSLTLTATFGDITETNTQTPTSTTVFTFAPPLVIPAGQTVNFSLSAVIAGGSAAQARSMVLSFGTKPGGRSGNGEGLQTTLSMLRDAAAGHSFTMLVGMILPILLLTLAFPSGIRPRVIAASVGLAIMTMTMATTMTACDPCPSCTTAKLTTTDQTVVSATVTGFDNQPFSVNGVPTLLSQLSK